MKKENGITLVALIVSIIVLLILATVSVQVLTGDNGLITKTETAKNETIKAEGLEKIQLAVVASYDNGSNINTQELAKNLSEINGLTDKDNNSIRQDSDLTLPLIIGFNETKYLIKDDGTVIKNPEYAKNGLILHLDGINNTRNGHSTTTTTWEDLSSNNNDFTKLSGASNAVWSNNSYVGDGINRTLVLNKAILSNLNECSVEVCYKIQSLPASGNYFWVFQNRQSGKNTGNGFQFVVNSSYRYSQIFSGETPWHIVRDEPTLDIRTKSFALNNTFVIFSNNGQSFTENTKNGIIKSVMERNCYSIGSAYPWSGTNYRFKGNIYSIRVYNRKLSEEELRNNYEVDRVRFNMD